MREYFNLRPLYLVILGTILWTSCSYRSYGRKTFESKVVTSIPNVAKISCLKKPEEIYESQKKFNIQRAELVYADGDPSSLEIWVFFWQTDVYFLRTQNHFRHPHLLNLADPSLHQTEVDPEEDSFCYYRLENPLLWGKMKEKIIQSLIQ